MVSRVRSIPRDIAATSPAGRRRACPGLKHEKETTAVSIASLPGAAAYSALAWREADEAATAVAGGFKPASNSAEEDKGPMSERQGADQWLRVTDRLRADLGEDVYSSW